MPLVKKISSTWIPVEHNDLKIGDILDVDNAAALVELGDAVYCDKDGNELSKPGVYLKCPACSYEEMNLFMYARHILTHEGKEEKKIEVTPVMEERIDKMVEKMGPVISMDIPVKRTPEEMRAFRIENLRKAREAKKAKI